MNTEKMRGDIVAQIREFMLEHGATPRLLEMSTDKQVMESCEPVVYACGLKKVNKVREVKIIYDGSTTAVDGSNEDVVKGIERILEEEAYRRKSSVWSVLKDLTVAVVNRERYLEAED